MSRNCHSAGVRLRQYISCDSYSLVCSSNNWNPIWRNVSPKERYVLLAILGSKISINWSKQVIWMKYYGLAGWPYHGLQPLTMAWSLNNSYKTNTSHTQPNDGALSFVQILEQPSVKTVIYVHLKLSAKITPQHFKEYFSSPFNLHDFTLIPACISTYMPSKVWDEIAYPFLNFNGATFNV